MLDYSKYKYEQAQKQKAARKHQQQITIREIKFRPKIAQNDYDTKKGHVSRFLKDKDKVKITIMFRGREVTHPERGTALLDRLAGELSEIAVVEQSPVQDGRNMTMLLAPVEGGAGRREGQAGRRQAGEIGRRARAEGAPTAAPRPLTSARRRRRRAEAARRRPPDAAADAPEATDDAPERPPRTRPRLPEPRRNRRTASSPARSKPQSSTAA